MPQGPQLSSLLKRKASTTLPHIPTEEENSHPLNPSHSLPLHPPRKYYSSHQRRHPAHHKYPTLQHAHHSTHHHKYPTLLHTTHITTSLLPISLLTTSPPLFPLSSTIPSPSPAPILPTQALSPFHRLHRQHPPFPPSGNPSR